MSEKRRFLLWWVGGLIAFAIVIVMSMPLMVDGVPGGILDHQKAGSGAVIDAIHSAWGAAGVLGTARNAMIGDLIFIGIYGFGALLAGRYFYRNTTRLWRGLGAVIAIAAVVFLLTDYLETSLQLSQLLQNAGADRPAAIAAAVGPAKSLSWIITFVGILLALIGERWFLPSS